MLPLDFGDAPIQTLLQVCIFAQRRFRRIIADFILQASLNVTVFVMCLVRDFGKWAFYHTSLTHKIFQTFEGKSFLE